MRLKLCKPYINGFRNVDTGHNNGLGCNFVPVKKMSRNAFKVMNHITRGLGGKYNNGWALGCQPPNFDPQISPKWHNSVKNV